MSRNVCIGVTVLPWKVSGQAFPSDTIAAPELLRPLLEYERLVGGRW
jgi:hypothetical protein